MMKRITSLLLALVMVFSLMGVAAFADDAAPAHRGDFNTNVDVGASALKRALATAEANYTAATVEGKENFYNPAEVAALKAVLDEVQALIDEYESHVNDRDEAAAKALDDKMAALAEKLDGVSTLSTNALPEDIKALEDAIAAVEAALAKAISTYEDDGTVADAKAALKNHNDGKATLSRQSILEKDNGWLDKLAAALEEAEENERQITVELKAEWNKDDSKVEYSFVDFNEDVDDYLYTLTATLNGKTVALIGKFATDGNCTEAVKGGELAKGSVTAETFKDFKVTELKGTDTITLVLTAYVKGNDFQTKGVYEKVEQVAELSVACKEPDPEPEVPVAKLAITAAGYTGDTTGKDYEIPAVLKDAGLATTPASDAIYVVLNGAPATGEHASYTGYEWRISIKGQDDIIKAIDDIKALTNKYVVIGFTADETAKLIPGNYTINLVGKGEKDGSLLTKTGTATVGTVDVAELQALVDIYNEMGDPANIEAHYGPYTKAVDLAKVYTGEAAEAKAALAELKPVADVAANRTKVDAAVTAIKGALDGVLNRTALQAAIAAAEAYDFETIYNYEDGLLKDAYLAAKYAELALSTKGTYADETPDFDPDFEEGDSIDTDAYPVPATQAEVDALVAELLTALKYLDTDPEPKNGWDEDHTHYYVDDEVQTGVFETEDGLYYGSVQNGGLVLTDCKVRAGGGKYYIADETGKLYTEQWVEYKDAKYYCAADGHIMRATAKGGMFKAADGKTYLVDENGAQLTGIQETSEGVFRYFSVADGHMMRNGVAKVGGGKTVTIDEKGVIVEGL